MSKYCINKLTPEKTITAEWQALVFDAMYQCGYHFDQAIEHYLIITLDHYTTDKNLASIVIALDFLQGHNKMGKESGLWWRQVGDRCLLIAGLFPERVKRKQVNAEYFISLGQQAYQNLADIKVITAYETSLFHNLSDNFIPLTKVLAAMRNVVPRKI